MAGHVMAIDAGTTAVKAVVFDDAGREKGSGTREFTTRYPRPGWVEQDPVEIREAALEVIGRALETTGISPADVEAIGITNQRSSIVAWEAGSGRPLSTMIGWQDSRTAERCLELQQQGFFIVPMMAAAKAEWILANVEEAASAARAGTLRLGTPNSWLAACLCGDLNLSDHGNASITGLYAHFEGSWDGNVLDALGLEHDWLPALVDSSGAMAATSPEVFGAEVPLAGMAGDQQAALFGLACLARGQTKCSYGTSAMVVANSADAVAVGGAGTYPVLAWRIGDETVYSIEGNVITAGAAVQWLRDGLGIVAKAADTSAMAEALTDSGGVWAVPAFQGLGTPMLNSDARALLGGLSGGSGPREIVRAVLEGVAQRVTDVAESVWEGSEKPAALRVDGGACLNDFLMQTQADLLGVCVERSSVIDGAAYGAAKLAGLAVGFWSDTVELQNLWQVDRTFEPTIGEDERSDRRERWQRVVRLAVEAAT